MKAKPLPEPGSLDQIETWLFDLDNTLYSADSRLFDQVDQRIGAFIARHFSVDHTEARRIQKGYFRQYGTTLRGLMIEHDIDPEHFLTYVHDIDFSQLEPADALGEALAKLPGRRLVFTNADTPYAERILEQLGIGDHFHDIHDIAAADYVPKPFPEAYAQLVERHAIEPERTVFFEDILRNLAPAAALGMITVWVRNENTWARAGEEDTEPHYVTDDIAAWLEAALEGVQSAGPS